LGEIRNAKGIMQGSIFMNKKLLTFLLATFTQYCTFSKSRLEVFSPDVNAEIAAEKLWYRDVKKDTLGTSVNDSVLLRFSKPTSMNILVTAKPTRIRAETTGFWRILTFGMNFFPASKLYAKEDLRLELNFGYDATHIAFGEDCFRVQFKDNISKGEAIVHDGPKNADINKIWKAQERPISMVMHVSVEVKFPINPYEIEEFELLSCSIKTQDQVILQPPIRYQKGWQTWEKAPL
jgi:hypothetical protein